MTTTTQPHISATGRLLAVLKDVRDARSGSSCLELLIRVSRDEASHPRSGHRLLARIYDLIEQARAEVAEHSEIKQPLYFSVLNRIDTHLRGANLQTTDNSIADPLGALIEPLELCADQMDRFSNELLLNPDEVQSLIAAVEELSAALRESDLPTELRTVLVRRADDMRRALVEYSLGGAQGLEQAVAAALGTLMQHAQVVRANSKSPALAKYFETVVKVDAAVRTIHRWMEIGAPVALKLIATLTGGAS